MSGQSSKIRVLVFVICVAPMLAGCSFSELLHHHRKGEEFRGFVRTTGPLAVSQTLPIPLEGLTLSQAVNQSIREGAVIPAGVTTVPTEPLPEPVQDQTPDLREDIKGEVGLVQERSGSETSIDTAAAALAKLGDGTPELEAKIKARLDQAKSDGLFDINNLPTDAQTQFAQLYSDLADIIGNSSAPPTVPQDSLTRTVAQVSNSTGPVAVQLSRRAGHRLIIPLEMVLDHAAGDIWLSNGDAIQIMPHSLTEAGQQLPIDGSTPVSEYSPEEVSGVNLLTLNHRSLIDGKLEQYLLPAKNKTYYPNEQFVQQWHNATWVLDSDQIKPGAMELNPLIRGSQQNSIAASAASLRARMNPPTTSLSDEIHAKMDWTCKTLGAMPVIGLIGKQVQHQTGRGSLGQGVRQTTGFDPARLNRRLTP